MQLPQTAAET